MKENFKIVQLSERTNSWMPGPENWVDIIIEEERAGWTPVIPCRWDERNNIPSEVIFRKKQ